MTIVGVPESRRSSELRDNFGRSSMPYEAEPGAEWLDRVVERDPVGYVLTGADIPAGA